jgi:peptidyl-tRNA hydrolase
MDGLIRGEYCNLKKNNNLTKLINLWQDKGQVKIVMSMLNNILVMLSHADKLSNASTMSNNNKSNMSHVTYHC